MSHLIVELLLRLLKVEKCYIALGGGVGGDDHLAHGVPLGSGSVDSLEELLHAELARADPRHGREGTVEHVIAAAKGPGALNGDQVKRLFDHAEEAEVAGGVAADAAEILVGDVAADRAGSGVGSHGADRPSEGERLGLGGAQQVEGEPFGGAWADPWESGEGFNEPLDGARQRCAAAHSFQTSRRAVSGSSSPN